MSYLDELRSFVAQKDADGSLTKPTEPPFVSFVGSLPERISDNQARLILREWHRKLSALNDCSPPGGYEMGRWQRLCDDACWIYEGFASRAVRDGWTSTDLFGVAPTCGEGGLADRLQGARNLKMSEWQAVWSSFGVSQRFGRGLLPSGSSPLWGAASFSKRTEG